MSTAECPRSAPPNLRCSTLSGRDRQDALDRAGSWARRSSPPRRPPPRRSRVRVGPAPACASATRPPSSGRVTEDGAPLAGRTVRLEVSEASVRGQLEARRRAAAPPPTAATRSPPRAQAQPPGPRAAGGPARATSPYVLPEPDALSPRRVRLRAAGVHARVHAARRARRSAITQTYTVPKAVAADRADPLLRRPVQAGPARPLHRERAPFATRRRRRGGCAPAATSRARPSRIPASFAGRFSYVSCFGYSKGSGMGDPGLRCPREVRRGSTEAAR